MTRKRAAIALGVVVALLAFGAWAAHRIGQLDPATQATNPIIRWEYLFSRERTREELWDRARQHLELTVVPVLLGTLLSTLLAALVLRFRWLQGAVLTFAGALYTVPSLALFGILVAYASNWVAAVVALTSYTLLIITRNILAGLDAVPPEVKAAADGLGMSPAQRLLRVELPLALPVILTGIRVATVTTVGLVGVSAVIQLGGLAYYIFDGFRRDFTTLIAIGSSLSILLAIVLDLALRLVERAATPWVRAQVPA